MPAPSKTNTSAQRKEAPGRGGQAADQRGAKGSGGKSPAKGRKDSGKGRGGRPGEERTPAPSGRVVETSVLVDRAAGVQVFKKSRTSFPGAKVIGISYDVVFDGHDPIVCERLGQARDRVKEGPPPAAPAEAAAEDPAQAS